MDRCVRCGTETDNVVSGIEIPDVSSDERSSSDTVLSYAEGGPVAAIPLCTGCE